MSLHLLNLGLRFCLELTALVAVGVWGWRQEVGWFRYALAIGLPVLLSVIWGAFNVPGDPSRSGHAPIKVAGIVRLAIEAMFFACGAYSLLSLGYTSVGGGYIIVLILHYIASFQRVSWLLKQGTNR